MHKQIDEERYATVWVLKTVNGFLRARVEKEYNPASELVKLHTSDGHSWYDAEFADGTKCSLQPYRWGRTQEEALSEDKRHYGFIWVDLREAGLIDGFSSDVLKQAIAASEALGAAKIHYEQTLQELGAEQKEEGNYEDYREWLELPGIPMVQF